jgi:hypothetical protein
MEPRPRPAPARRSGAGLQMQQQALFQLIVGGILVAVLCVGMAYVSFGGLGRRNVRSVAPVIESFMRAGADANALAGHSLYSAEGLREVTRQDVDALFARRDLFDGFRNVSVSSLRFAPGTGPAIPESATVIAVSHYDHAAPARIVAQLDLDPSGWRLRSIRITRDES